MKNRTRNILIGVGSAIVVIIIAILAIFFLNKPQQKVHNAKSNTKTTKVVKPNKVKQANQEVKENYEKQEAKKTKNQVQPAGVDQTNMYRTNIIPTGSGTKDPNEVGTKKMALNDLAKQQFKSYEERMDSNFNNYRYSTGIGLDVAGLYSDEQTFESALNNHTDSLQNLGANFARNVKTPEGFVILGLYFDQLARSRFMLDPDAISPAGFNAVQYVSTTKYTQKNLNKATKYQGKNLVKNAWYAAQQGAVYVVRFKIKDTGNWITYDGIVGETPTGKLLLYGYYPLDKYRNKITDHKLKDYFTKDFKDFYRQEDAKELQRIQQGKVDPNKLYPWIEKGGQFD